MVDPLSTHHHFALGGGLALHFYSACTLTEATVLQFGAHLPGLTVLRGKAANPDLSLTHSFGMHPCLEDDGDRVKLHTAFSADMPEDVAHLLYGMQRRKLQQSGLFPVHAACVGRDGRFILIAGHSGSGKTTLAQKLVDEHGFRLLSGNKTVLRFEENGQLTAIAGTTTMTALDNTQGRHAYTLPPQVYARGEQPVAGILLPRLNDGVCEHQQLKGLSALHTLYPYFTDAVNADVIVNGKDLFDGTTPKAARAFLARALPESLHRTEVRKASGSLQHLTNAALKL